MRRDIWMFAQIVGAFVSKARHADPSVDHWGKLQSFSFVRELLGYFRAMGFPLLRVGLEPVPVRHALTVAEIVARFAHRDGLALGEAARCASFPVPAGTGARSRSSGIDRSF